jgi:hypothetical protein
MSLPVTITPIWTNSGLASYTLGNQYPEDEIDLEPRIEVREPREDEK